MPTGVVSNVEEIQFLGRQEPQTVVVQLFRNGADLLLAVETDSNLSVLIFNLFDGPWFRLSGAGMPLLFQICTDFEFSCIASHYFSFFFSGVFAQLSKSNLPWGREQKEQVRRSGVWSSYRGPLRL